jgi:hypothetical protein
MAKFRVGRVFYDELSGDTKEFCVKRGAHFPDTDLMNIVEVTELSIEKWQYIVNRIKKTKAPIWDGGTTTCALCLKYFGSCSGCPIRAVTGFGSCAHTPYTEYERSDHVDYIEDLKIAREELKFLKAEVLKKAKEIHGKDS